MGLELEKSTLAHQSPGTLSLPGKGWKEEKVYRGCFTVDKHLRFVGDGRRRTGSMFQAALSSSWMAFNKQSCFWPLTIPFSSFSSLKPLFCKGVHARAICVSLLVHTSRRRLDHLPLAYPTLPPLITAASVLTIVFSLPWYCSFQTTTSSPCHTPYCDHSTFFSPFPILPD